MEKIIGIYKIENLSNGKCYIGSSTNCRRRLREHRRQLVDGCHPARDMQEDFDNGDQLKATIIERLANGVDRDTLLLHENRYIRLRRPGNRLFPAYPLEVLPGLPWHDGALARRGKGAGVPATQETARQRARHTA